MCNEHCSDVSYNTGCNGPDPKPISPLRTEMAPSAWAEEKGNVGVVSGAKGH